jgi:hypothetical protein
MHNVRNLEEFHIHYDEERNLIGISFYTIVPKIEPIINIFLGIICPFNFIKYK